MEKNSTKNAPSPEALLSREYRNLLKTWITIVAVAVLGMHLEPLPVSAQTSNLDIATSTSDLETSPEVFYGEPATPEQAAFSAMVFGHGIERFSGIIVGPRVIATALHGVKNRKEGGFYDAEEFTIKVAGDPSQPVYKVKEIRIIGNSVSSNDRVLLLLEEPITFSEKVHAIQLGDFGMRYADDIFVIGHGTYEDHNYTEYPRVGKQTITTDTGSCNSPNVYVTKNEDGVGAVAYQRDSGGGLIAKIPEGNEYYSPGYYLLGTTSVMCSESTWIDSKIIPDYLVAFQSMTIPSVKDEVVAAIEETNAWVSPKETYLPYLSKPTTTTFLPSARK